jgi:hypothetical protein
MSKEDPSDVTTPEWRPVPLSTAIAQIRRQLEEAMQDGDESPLAFRPGAVELEFEVAFSASGSGEFGVKAWVISAGAKGEVSRAVTNRMKISLTPVNRDGSNALIGSVGDQ